MTTHDDSHALTTAYRIAAEHPDHPLSAAVYLLVDELERQRAVLASHGDRIAELAREKEEPAP